MVNEKLKPPALSTLPRLCMLVRLLSPPGLRGGPSPLTPQASRGNLRWSLGRMLVVLQGHMLGIVRAQMR